MAEDQIAPKYLDGYAAYMALVAAGLLAWWISGQIGYDRGKSDCEAPHTAAVAAMAAEATAMCKRKGERDTEFVKRIVCAYMNAHTKLHPEVCAAKIGG